MMQVNVEKLQETLCSLMCAEVRIRPRNANLLVVDTPFYFPDGDPYQIFIKERPGGILRLSDMGHTLMQLSYDNDIDKFREGTRGNLFDQIKAEMFVEEDEGEFFIDTEVENLGASIFRFGQAITKINDLTFLNRWRAESTFYEDLEEQLYRFVPPEKVAKDYIYLEMENAGDYPIDYRISATNAPLYVFGIPNRDKARLTTIILEHLLRARADFDSLLIFANQVEIPKRDLARLSNVGGEQIASLDATIDFQRKIQRKIDLN